MDIVFIQKDQRRPIFTRENDDMTTLGIYFAKKLINRAELSRKTGITPNRMYNLVENENSEIRGKEVHLIALALEIEPNQLHEILFGDVKLP